MERNQCWGFYGVAKLRERVFKCSNCAQLIGFSLTYKTIYNYYCNFSFKWFIITSLWIQFYKLETEKRNSNADKTRKKRTCTSWGKLGPYCITVRRNLWMLVGVPKGFKHLYVQITAVGNIVKVCLGFSYNLLTKASYLASFLFSPFSSLLNLICFRWFVSVYSNFRNSGRM